ncbi:hypothetical protein JCM24511_08367 [Saitozyma sp. JCM 24511]|nr:hypothetical protein JCM24511_08367 [Saitozyma sp. JCM 24511]
MSTSSATSNVASAASAAPLPPPHRLIHTHDPSTGAPLLREDTVPINPMGNGDPSAYGMIYVQDQLKADPAKALEGPDKTPDTMWVCSTGVTSAWIDLPPKYDSRMAYTTSMSYIVVILGSVEIGFHDGTSRLLHPGDVYVNAASVHKWGNPTDQWTRLVGFSTPSEELSIKGQTLDKLLDAKKVF